MPRSSRNIDVEKLLLDMTRRMRPEAHWIRAAVTFDLGRDGAWGLHLDSGRAAVSAVAPGEPDVFIRTNADALCDIFEGRRAGYEVFLDGEMETRGNLSLAMELESLFVPPAPRPPEWAETLHVKVGRLRWSILRTGPLDAPPVFLFHGLGGTKASMLTTVRALAKDHRVFACDLPGFGDSAKPRAPYDAVWFAERTIEMLDALEIKQAGFIGNSMGGRIALEVGFMAPDRCRSLVLLCPALGFLRYRSLAPIVRWVLRPELAFLPVAPPRGVITSALRGIFCRADRVPDFWFEAGVDEFLRVWRKPRGRHAFAAAARHIYLDEPHGERGFWTRLRGMDVPAQFVFGRQDPLVPASLAEQVAEVAPSARIAILEDCGHVPQLEDPERTHRLAKAVLAV